MIVIEFTHYVSCDGCKFIRKSFGIKAKVWNYGGTTPCAKCGSSLWGDVIARRVYSPKLRSPSTWFKGHWEVF